MPPGKLFETNGRKAVWYESNDCYRRDCQAAGATEEDASQWEWGVIETLGACGPDSHAYHSVEGRIGGFEHISRAPVMEVDVCCIRTLIFTYLRREDDRVHVPD